jgi:hypothetical protein
MADGKLNRRIHLLEREVAEMRGDIKYLKSISHPRENDLKSISSERDSQHQNQPSESIVGPLEPTVANTENTRRNANNPRSSWWRVEVMIKRFKPLIEVVGIFFAIFYAIVTYRQWHDLRRNFEADQRAWIRAAYLFPKDISSDSKTSVTLEMSNLGKSVITGVVAFGNYSVVDNNSLPPFFSKDRSTATFTRGGFFPGEKGELDIPLLDPRTKQSRAFTNEELEGLRSGKKYVTAIGMIGYWDQFGYH